MEPLGYSVESRKAATDDGSRSTAEAEVLVGGEVLRGTAVGGGPVDALEKAMRAALAPVYPGLADVTLVDFASAITEDRRVRVSVRGSAPGVDPWPGEAVANDLLHASWLAVAECFQGAIDGALVVAAEAPARRVYPTVSDMALRLNGWLDPDDSAVMARLDATDWTKSVLDITSRDDRWFAACAASLGATLLYSFGNFCAMAGHPRLESIQRINLQKGRPVNQVGSITSTPLYFESLFDWSALPAELTREGVTSLMDAFFELGPMGFRGPAAPSITAQLTSFDGAVKTTQLVAPGSRCPSNDLIQSIMGMVGREYLFATSANVSSGVTGRVEPAHYDMAGIQDDFGREEGVVLIGHPASEEEAVRASYPQHLPMSVSILAFHKVVVGDDGRPSLVLERHGSMEAGDVAAVLDEHGLGMVVGEGAQERLPMRVL